jgi:UDP-glucuronate 4-epimerase
MRNPDLTVYEADIWDIEAIRAIFAANDFVAIAHLAARADVLSSLRYPNLYFEVNFTSTLNLLNCCKEFGVKQFLFGSSSSVYGLGAKAPFSESYKAQPPMPSHAASKSAA